MGQTVSSSSDKEARPAQSQSKAVTITTDEEILASLDLDAPGMEKVKAAVQARNLDAIKKAYLDYRRNSSRVRWSSIPGDDPVTVLPTVLPLKEMPSAIASADEKGDKVLSKYGKGFDWTYSPIPRFDPKYTDEWTWGVVRMGFWRSLCEAYVRTHDDKYAAGWVAQMEDFIEKNPCDPGANPIRDAQGNPSRWRTLETGLRMAYAWPEAYFHFLKSPSFTPEAHWLYLRSVYDHARHLGKGLEKKERNGNWVTTECYGLYTAGILFPELRDSVSWRKLAMERMLIEIGRSVPPDGFEVELTPHYHVVALHGFLGVYLLAKLNGDPVSESYKEKLLSMYRALVWMMDPAGLHPPVNESWGNDVTNSREMAKEALLLVGDDPVLKWAASEGKEGTPVPESTMLPHAGFYTMRGGWKNDDFFLFFRGGPVGTAHRHEDMLKIFLRAYGQVLLFEPWGYRYDNSEWRNYVIGTASHNTIVVDGKWQHRGGLPPEYPAKPVGNPWASSPIFDYVAATYDAGFRQAAYGSDKWLKWEGALDRSVSHTRRILYFKPNYALVLDSVDGVGSHTVDALFHMDARDALVDPATQSVVGQFNGDVRLGLYPADRERLSVEVVQGQKEPLLGWRVAVSPKDTRPMPTARFRKVQEAPTVMATFLYPYKGSAPKFQANPLDVKGEGIWSGKIQTSDENIEIVISKNGVPTSMKFQSEWLGEVQAKASVLLVRRPIKGGKIFCGAYGISEYRDKACSFASDTQTSLAWTLEVGKILFYNAGGEDCEVGISAPFSKKANLLPGLWTEITRENINAVKNVPKIF